MFVQVAKIRLQRDLRGEARFAGGGRARMGADEMVQITRWTIR